MAKKPQKTNGSAKPKAKAKPKTKAKPKPRATAKAKTVKKVEKVDNGDIANRNVLEAKLKAAVFGEIMSVMLQSPRHKNVTLETLARQMVPAFMSDQYVLARAQADNVDVPPTAVGVAFWASVSDEVDSRLSADPLEPIEIKPDEWRSGDIIWLLDIVAAPQVSAALVKSIREKVGADKVIKVRAANADGKPSVKTLD